MASLVKSFFDILDLSFDDSSSRTTSVVAASEIARHNEEWNARFSLLHRVPADVRLIIMSHLPDLQQLLQMRLCCRLLGRRDLSVSSRFWNMWCEQRLAHGAWSSYCINRRWDSPPRPRGLLQKMFSEEPSSTASSSSLSSSNNNSSSVSAFRYALGNAYENSRFRPAELSSPNPNLVANQAERAWLVTRERTLLERLEWLTTGSRFVGIFGNALETSARRLVYRLMWGTQQHAPLFPVTGVFPGSAGMGGGVSFSISGKSVQVAPFYAWGSEGITLSNTLQRVVGRANGLVFVVDDSMLDNPEETERVAQLAQMVRSLVAKKDDDNKKEEEATKKNLFLPSLSSSSSSSSSVPILLLNFAPDGQKHIHDPRRVLQMMGLQEDAVVNVRNVPESADFGVAEGFEWLTETMYA